MFTMFTNKKRGGIDTFVRAVSLSVAETPNASIKDQEPQLPIVPFGIVVHGFVGQTFSKQLYVLYLVRPNVSPPHKEA